MGLAAPSAYADFGFLAGPTGFDGSVTNADGTPDTQAGSHPYEVTTSFSLNTTTDSEGNAIPDGGSLKDTRVNLPPGLVGDPNATPQCSLADFFTTNQVTGQSICLDNAAVGTLTLFFPSLESVVIRIYNLQPPAGSPAEFGATFTGHPILLTGSVRSGGDYGVSISSLDISQALSIAGVSATFWGVPADPSHDPFRGSCLNNNGTSNGNCPAGVVPKPLLTLPTSCAGPQTTTISADSWSDPGVFEMDSFLSHDNSNNPIGIEGCDRLDFSPSITAKPTTEAASSATGLDFNLDVKDEGLTNPAGIAGSDIKKVEVTLPEGFSTNPSLAEGLNVCTEADLENETLESAPGTGCPNESKIGTVEVQSPLLEEPVDGALYIAKPYENPSHSLLALYVVVKNPILGIIIKQALMVEPNPFTGQLTTVAEELPQLPFSHFRLHFRQGARSPLVTPPACGEYSAKAVLTPWSGEAPVAATSAFTITSGADNTACPSAGTPPFHPGLDAGTLNNTAGHYSPFYIRLSRQDGEQEITHFSIKLPPGVIGKLAGIPFCSDAQIAAAKARIGPHGGAEELANPSCPAASEVGHTLVGAGVGSALTYAPGKIYLAGPYHGSPLSLVSITAAKVGPFDLGTVVVRFALRINPETAEVFVDATGSDPIPHIIQGIPVHLRDIRAYVDRPEFVLNPTSCARTSTASTVLGSGLDFASAADDQPLVVSSPFQAADCASLPFRPNLKLSLKGASKRTGDPAFKAKLTMKPGEANIARSVVTLPHSEFLDNSHIRTVCTKTVYNQGAIPGENCPADSIYGRARATSPILDETLEGPVFLRTPGGKLPDLVASLHSQKVNITLVGHVDSVRSKTKSGEAVSRIRNTFAAVPDAPVSSFVLEMQGGKKGLLENSTDLCQGTHRADVEFTGHNGKQANSTPAVSASCGKGGKKKHRRTRR
jgi:hypothetical protein